MSYLAKHPALFLGQSVDTGECVAFVKKSANAPCTPAWKEGAKVWGNINLLSGTAIATFQEGRYQNHKDGSSHAAIYVAQMLSGILVYDQWHGSPVKERLIRFNPKAAKICNNADNYYVIET